MAEQSELAGLFDAHYFAHGCGREYRRDRHWLDFFDSIAARIVAEIAPETMLDAGCAMGFLVEKMRSRQVEAWGVDISEYAIQNVHPDIQPFCWVGSVAEPLPRRYDLIVCIEVLEHLPKSESEKALRNLCSATDDILFSSSPLDYRESTHFNVQPPDYWAELFARQGFFRDVDFDASFITPWAARFRRRQDPLHRIVRDYERKYYPLWAENAEVREQLVALEKSVAHLQPLADEVNKLRAQVRHWESVWADTEQSTGWQILHKVRLWQMRVAPPGSRRGNLLRAMSRLPLAMAREGPIGYARRRAKGLRSRIRRLLSRQDLSYAAINARAYQRWIQEHTLTEEELDRQRQVDQSLAYRPLISFVTPVFNPPAQVLRETIESVRGQTYDNWELCLADGASTAPGVQDALATYAEQDDRIRVQRLEENLGISGNSNAALAMAQGEYIALLDHDDLLEPHMLFEVVRLLNEVPDADLIYFDEDKISEDGLRRSDPFFKPDWSPEMFLSANYLTHAVYRRALVERAGGFDPQTDGAQDWDLAFRVTAQTDRVLHIPTVLYHWRQIGGSTAGQFGAKSWVFDTQLGCVREHLKRRGIQDGQAHFDAPGFVRVTWPASGRKVSIIIPTRDKVEYLRRCIKSIQQLTEYANYEIILVDNESQRSDTREYYETLQKQGGIKIVDYPAKFNFSQANNIGVSHAQGEIFLFLNNDVEILEPDWLEEMVRWAELPEIGAVGTKLLFPDGRIQHAGVIVGMEGHASHVFYEAREKQGGPFGSVDWYRNFTAVTGACLMMRREVYEQVGGFNESYILAFSDIELCMRVVQQGYRVLYTPYARMRHYEGRSRGDHIPAHDILIGVEHFIERVQAGDPYFNPNLSYTRRMPTIAGPDEEDRGDRLLRIGRSRRHQ